MNNKYTDKKIVCPYCFKEFMHNEVHFRLETVRNDGYNESDIEYEIDPQKKEEIRTSIYFQPKNDEKYMKFWERFGQTTELTTNNEATRFGCEVYQLPIVDPMSADAKRCLQMQNHGNGESNFFVYDGDGVVQAVVDIYGERSHRRVCPHCHNPLPNTYGKYNVKFISVIGVSGAGKTVYISQLLRNMSVYCHKFVRMTAHTMDDKVDNFIAQNAVKRGNPLPVATMSGLLSQPMTYNIVKNDREIETFVIYDIAGENCVNDNQMQNYGDFVIHSDGIVLLISPNQIGFTEDNDQDRQENGSKDKEDAAPPATVLNTIYNTIVSTTTGKCKKPIAVCISKSDIFADSLGGYEDNANDIVKIAKRDVEPVRDSTGNVQSVFNATEYNVLQKRLTSLLDDDPISGMLKSEYELYNYFIFSAVGCGVKSEVLSDGRKISCPIDDPHPIRSAEPLLWLFKRFGYIKSDVPIRLPALRGDPNQKVPLYPTWFQRVVLKYPEWRCLTPEEKEALWYEERC